MDAMRSPPGLVHRWRSAVDELADRSFLVYEADDGRVTAWTYREMDELVGRVAQGLADRGVEPGTPVHLVHGNSVAFVATWLACASSGAWIVPSDPRASAGELAQHIARTRPRVGICSPARGRDYRAAVEAAQHDVDVVDVHEDDVELAELVGAAPAPRGDVDPETLLGVLFTSGTTSTPKGVEVTQANYAFAGDVMASVSGLTRFDRCLVVLPLFHANAQYYSFAAAISVGASVALMSGFSASGFVEQARRHRVTHASLFAAPIRMILARTPPGTEPLSLRHAWFAQNLSTEQYDAARQLLGCTPRQIYGMTETAPAVLVNPPVGSVPSAMGVPTLGCHLRVVDAALHAPPAGTSGAIQVGGRPGLTIFRGYLDDPDGTEAAIVEREADGFVWFDTGDRATVDEAGFHYFDGRRSDVLKVAGENVSVVEVEHALAEHPRVVEVAVVGVPDPVRDEVPEAYVVVSGGHEGVEAELADWSERWLAPSKRPRAYHLVDELPRTSVGKIRKFLLRAEPSGVGPHLAEHTPREG
jgi:carnitine-CoA ligase